MGRDDQALYEAAERARERSDLNLLRHRAGRAADDPDSVREELAEACDFFADWSDADLSGLRWAGGRVERLARQLLAAERWQKALAERRYP